MASNFADPAYLSSFVVVRLLADEVAQQFILGASNSNVLMGYVNPYMYIITYKYIPYICIHIVVYILWVMYIWS